MQLIAMSDAIIMITEEKHTGREGQFASADDFGERGSRRGQPKLGHRERWLLYITLSRIIYEGCLWGSAILMEFYCVERKQIIKIHKNFFRC